MSIDWTPIAATGLGAAIAFGGQLVAGFIQGRNQRASERRSRAQRDAEILAAVDALLTDVNPDRVGINANSETFTETFTGFHDRWQAIRIPLLTMHIGHHSAKVRDLAGKLQVATANSLTSATWFVKDLLGPQSSLAYKPRADADHAEARQLAEGLATEIRRRAG